MSGLQFAKPAKGTALLERRRRRLDRDEALRDAYTDVDRRDAGYCRVTGRYTQPGAVDPRIRREHHHLVSRSRSRALRASAANIITCCAEAHALIEGGFIVVEGTNANRPNAIRCHWNGLKPSERPFEIRSRRASQIEE